MHLGLGLLPIVPILLLPFIFIFFVIVFPLWGVTLGVLGTLLLVVRGADWVARRAGVSALSGASRAVFVAFRWVLTFGGLSNRLSDKAD